VIEESFPTAAAELLTLEETAAVLRTPLATLRYWRRLGVGPDDFRLGWRVVYRREDVDRWVAERQKAQPTAPIALPREDGPGAGRGTNARAYQRAPTQQRGPRVAGRRHAHRATPGQSPGRTGRP
jgi:hypothetical protein